MKESNDQPNCPRIRPFQKKDLETVYKMEKASFSDPWPREAFLEGLDGSFEHYFIVAECDGRIAGYAAYYVDIGEARLTNIAVDKAFRRKSIAKSLLNHIFTVVKNASCRHLFLDVRPSNKAAIDLYVKLGFSQAYVRTLYYESPPEDALVMVKEILQD